MSAYRDLKNAQSALIEAVRGWVVDWDKWHPDRAPAGTWAPVYEAYKNLEREQIRLDEAGGSSARFTSINAGHANLPTKGSLRWNILLAVVAQQAQFQTGMTVAELKGRLRKEHSSVSSAINALFEHGWLRDSGARRNTQHGQPAIVWEPTEMAVEKCRQAALAVGGGR